MAKKNFTWSDAHIFQEIACQQQRGGANPHKIVDGIDFRQKYHLSDSELIGGLRRLDSAHLIEKEGARFVVSKDVENLIPKTPQGDISFKSQAWDELYELVMGLK